MKIQSGIRDQENTILEGTNVLKQDNKETILINSVSKLLKGYQRDIQTRKSKTN